MRFSPRQRAVLVSSKKITESAAPRTVLIVEDETNIRDLISLHLGLEGYTLVPAADGREALRVATERPFDLIVLDLMIPGLDGLTVCRAIRRSSINRDAPILMLTACREESDKVLGLESGADDYLTKPFGVRELVARVRALMRRTERFVWDLLDLARLDASGSSGSSRANHFRAARSRPYHYLLDPLDLLDPISSTRSCPAPTIQLE